RADDRGNHRGVPRRQSGRRRQRRGYRALVAAAAARRRVARDDRGWPRAPGHRRSHPAQAHAGRPGPVRQEGSKHMPVQVSYPGVYVEELPSAVRTITGVPTSITAFVGRAWRGPVDEPVKISSYADYERTFGGLWRDSPMSYAVQQFFLNGGSQAIIVRVAPRKNATATPEAKPATFKFTNGTFIAANPGSWGTNLTILVEDSTNTKKPSDPALFNLKVLDDPGLTNDAIKRGGSGASEVFLNV